MFINAKLNFSLFSTFEHVYFMLVDLAIRNYTSFFHLCLVKTMVLYSSLMGRFDILIQRLVPDFIL